MEGRLDSAAASGVGSGSSGAAGDAFSASRVEGSELNGFQKDMGDRGAKHDHTEQVST